MKYLKSNIVSILVVAVSSIIASWMFQPVSGQSTSDNVNKNKNIAGPIPITINQTMVSHLKTSLGDVTTIAEKSIGPDSHAVLAVLQTNRGSLVYTIWIADSDSNFHRIQVDPANGKVLSSEPLTIAMREQELLEMQHGTINPGLGGTMNLGQAGPAQGGFINPGQSAGQGGMMNPGQSSSAGQSAGQGGMMSPGQAAPGQSGMNGKP